MHLICEITECFVICLQVSVIDVWWSLQVIRGSHTNRPSKQRFSPDGCRAGGNCHI